jgi:hypothetical protein
MTLTCTRFGLVVALSVLMTVLTTSVYAEDTPIDTAVSHVGLGGGISFINPHSSDGDRSTGASVVYLWHSFHSHWGPSFGLDWHDTDFHQPLGSGSVPLGTLRMRALLAGVGGTQRFGKFWTSASLLAGYSFNDFSVAGGAAPAFGSAGISLVGVSVNNCAMVKPAVSAWYDVVSHVGVGIGAGYIVARPDRTMTTATGTEVHTLRADAWELTAGVVFGLWKKH